MLLQNFYTIHTLQQSEGSLEASIEFNADHDIFKGHFPTIPVVPGVCMMQIVKELLEQTIAHHTQLTKAAHLKFLSVITPGNDTVVQVKLRYSNTESGIDVQAEILNTERTFFKFKGSFSIQQK